MSLGSNWLAVFTGAVGAACIGLLLWVAPPADLIREIGDMNPSWVIAAVAFEVLSCLSYVVVFRRFFPEPSRAVTRQVALSSRSAATP